MGAMTDMSLLYQVIEALSHTLLFGNLLFVGAAASTEITALSPDDVGAEASGLATAIVEQVTSLQAAANVQMFTCGDGVDVDLGEEGKTFKVHGASYGTEPWTDATEAAQGVVADGKFTVGGGVHAVLGDPAPGVPKTFVMFYSVF